MKHEGPSSPSAATPAVASPQTVRLIAARAEADIKTVKRVLGGLPTKASPRERVLRAIRELKLDIALPGAR
jgi:DNA-binding LacI/PurR family transcriptional regulator